MNSLKLRQHQCRRRSLKVKKKVLLRHQKKKKREFLINRSNQIRVYFSNSNKLVLGNDIDLKNDIGILYFIFTHIFMKQGLK